MRGDDWPPRVRAKVIKATDSGAFAVTLARFVSGAPRRATKVNSERVLQFANVPNVRTGGGAIEGVKTGSFHFLRFVTFCPSMVSSSATA